MAPRKLPDLSPDQVIALQDALLENADQLLTSSLQLLDAGRVALARSLAILGMEESGKAIALHDRRVGMAYADEGEPFVDGALQKLWGSHQAKLETVHDFLVQERYWFGVKAPDPDENAEYLGAIEEWTKTHRELKEAGFYVDVDPSGAALAPSRSVDAETVRQVVEHVHQIGWQLRLGEHIEGKQQASMERDIPPATEDEVAAMRETMRSLDPEMVDRIVEDMRAGTPGTPLNNAAYRIRLLDNPFANMGRPGYEAEDRELASLAIEVGLIRPDHRREDDHPEEDEARAEHLPTE